VLVPSEFVAESVYTIVLEGETEVEPERATLPIPGSIATVSALVTVQVMVVDSPEVRLLGLAANWAITGFPIACSAGSWSSLLFSSRGVILIQPASDTLDINNPIMQ
jgi:hypothetical protein